MGLDMYLTGEKYLPRFNTKPEDRSMTYHVKTEDLELGRWWKHLDLHGFIIHEFADNIDECQRLDLGINDMKEIISAIKDNTLLIENDEHCKDPRYYEPHDNEDQKAYDIETFKKAIVWLTKEENGVSKSVIYQADW